MMSISKNTMDAREARCPLKFSQMLRADPELGDKEIIGAKIDEHIYSLEDIVPEGDDLEIHWLSVNEPAGRQILQNSCLTLLATALQQQFEGVQLADKGVDDNGFFYDFDTASRLKAEDLETLETVMRDLIKTHPLFKVERVSIEKANTSLHGAVNHYREQMMQAWHTLSERVYQIDYAGHLEFSNQAHAIESACCSFFKLLTISGTYWKGDSSERMIQRIYGTAYGRESDLQHWLEWRNEMKERDHRLLGKKLDLFHFQEESPGAAFWHPKGLRIIRAMKRAIRQELEARDYWEVSTPQILNRSLWERSGHWEQFSENMFSTHAENQMLAVKPMSCPGHIQIFNQTIRSHHDLPIRLCEFGLCHRKEPSGSLHGLMRGRVFTQDDVHIFCTLEQLKSEILSCIEIIKRLYKKFGFDTFEIKCSTRPNKRFGEEKTWDFAENTLIDLMERSGYPHAVQKGEGAFYGPKLEFTLKDALGRSWQCGTVQLDFVLPERLDVHYVSASGSLSRPIMIHCAHLGSLERFLAIILENYAGALPFWMAPVHCSVLTISEKQKEYAKKVAALFKSAGLWVETDLGDEKIGFKVREKILQKVPFLIICGDQEVATETVSVRMRGEKEVSVLPPEKFALYLSQALKNYSNTLSIGGCCIER